MARSLIRLPQLNAGSLAESTFAFATEAGQGILTLDATSGSEKIQAVVDQEMLNKKLSFLDGSSNQVAEISAAGAFTTQGDLLLSNGDPGVSANHRFQVTASSGDVVAAGLANLDGGIEVDNGGNKFTVDTSGNMLAVGTAEIQGLANLDGGIELDNGGIKFSVSTAGAMVVDSTAEIRGLANLDGGIEVFDGSENVFTVDAASGDTKIAGSLEVTGDLSVLGTRTFLNTQESSVEDTTIALGIPGGMMDMQYTVTSVDDDGAGGGTGNGYDEITVVYDNASLSGSKSGGSLANGDEIYIVSSDLQDGFKEGVVSLTANPTGSGASTTVVLRVDAGTYSATNGTAAKGFMSTDVFQQSKPYDGTGLVLPGAERTVGLRWSGTSNAMELTQSHFRVIDSSILIERDTNNASAHKIEFASGNSGISLTAAAPTAVRDISVPDASGVMAVSVATSGGQAQGAENFGLQLSSAGQLSIDIDGIGGSLNSAGLDAADIFMLADDSDANKEIKKTTLGDIQSFLSSGGTQKEYIVAAANANGEVSYSSLDAGFISALEAAAEGSREIYLNGILMRENEGATAHDVLVDSANDRLDFTFAIEADDVILIVVRA